MTLPPALRGALQHRCPGWASVPRTPRLLCQGGRPTSLQDATGDVPRQGPAADVDSYVCGGRWCPGASPNLRQTPACQESPTGIAQAPAPPGAARTPGRLSPTRASLPEPSPWCACCDVRRIALWAPDGQAALRVSSRVTLALQGAQGSPVLPVLALGAPPYLPLSVSVSLSLSSLCLSPPFPRTPTLFSSKGSPQTPETSRPRRYEPLLQSEQIHVKTRLVKCHPSPSCLASELFKATAAPASEGEEGGPPLPFGISL